MAAALTDPYVSSYAYVRNNPLRWSDPSGECPWCVLAGIGAAVGGVVGGASYALTAGDDFSVGGLLGATAGGAIAGATIGVSAPIAGTMAAFAGASSTGAVAFATTATINFTGGVAGQIVASLGAGDELTPGSVIGAGAVNAGIGMIGNAMWSLRGIATMRQVPHFAPRSWAGFFGRGVNASIAWRNAAFGGMVSTWWTAANYGLRHK